MRDGALIGHVKPSETGPGNNSKLTDWRQDRQQLLTDKEWQQPDKLPAKLLVMRQP